MRRALIVLAVLGSGTALTFLIAGAIFLADPDGHLVDNRGVSGVDRGGGVQIAPGKPVPLPVPMPADGTQGMEGNGLAVERAPLVTTIDVGGPLTVELPPRSGTQP